MSGPASGGDLGGVIRARHMVRNFADAPIDDSVLDELLDLARRAPSAGNTQAVEYLVLAGPETAAYWDVTLPAPKRRRFRWQGLLAAPVLLLLLTRPEAYRERYAETDKDRADTLGADLGRWPVPYWWVDAGAVAQNVLLLATDAGLGACLFGAFDHERAVLDTLGVPDDRRLVATIALGHPRPDEPGRSAGRRRPPVDEIRRRGRWTTPPPPA
ncbi:MAG: nitroreductase family protein [Acidimicrobiales bacterium]